jgi:adenylate cyclase
MPEERLQRRLSAILAADVVGYSRMMGRDEAGTLARLKSLRAEFLHPKVAEYGGRIVKTTGDGTLIEFGSAVDAVAHAVDVQRGMAERNASLPKEEQVWLRLGINVGDIIIDGDDIFGDGVNVAARLEALAEPGGICISDRVHDYVGDRLDITCDDLGQQAVKNVAEPVHIYRIRLGHTEATSTSESQGPAALPDNPSIAVLPFEDMSADKDQEYFADGMVEDIITALSRFNQFKVIARNSAFVYKGRNVDVRQVGRELSVLYVLEGSVRRSGNRLRITGQLIEASNGTHLWAERFDGDLEDVFELQDRITESVIGAIEPALLFAEVDRARRLPPESLAAYDLYLQALPYLYAFRPEENRKALDLLYEAIDRDPDYGIALAYCAWGYEQRLTRGWEAYGDNDADSAIQLARRALETKTNDPRALAAAGFVLVMVGRDYNTGLSAIRRAEELNPNVAFVSMHIGVALMFAGESIDRALAHLEHAIRVSPGDPGGFTYRAMSAFCHFHAGRDEMAVELARRAVDVYPDWDTTYWVLVPALARSGRMEEARAALEELRRLSPHITGSLLRQTLPYRDKDMLEAVVNGLVAAGLPQ